MLTSSSLVTPVSLNFLAHVIRPIALLHEQPMKVALQISNRSDAPKIYTLPDSYYVSEIPNIATNVSPADYLAADVQVFTRMLTYLLSGGNTSQYMDTPITGNELWPVQLVNITPPPSPLVLRSRQVLVQLLNSIAYIHHPLVQVFYRLVLYQSNAVVYGQTIGIGDAVAQFDAPNLAWRVAADSVTYPAPGAGIIGAWAHGPGFRNAIIDNTTEDLLAGRPVRMLRTIDRSIIVMGRSPALNATLVGNVFLPDVIASTFINVNFKDFKLHAGFLEFVNRFPLDISARALAVLTQLANTMGIVLAAPSWVQATPQAIITTVLAAAGGTLSKALSLAYISIIVVCRYWLELCTARPEYAILNKFSIESIEATGHPMR